MQPIRARLCALAASLSLLMTLPSCEAITVLAEGEGVTKDGQVHDGGLALEWHGLDVWSDGSTVHYAGQMKPAADSPSAIYVIVMRIGNWSHCVLTGIGGGQMQAVEGSVAVPDAEALGPRPCGVELTGHLDTVDNALQGKSQSFRVGIAVLRRTDPLPAGQ